MKTTLKTLICTALCCAAWSAYAQVSQDTTTAMAFKGAAGCTGADVPSVPLSGNSNPDVYIQSTTTLNTCSPSGCTTFPVTSGVAQVYIATDGLGNPTSVANNACWVALTGLETSVNTSGQACIGIDLEGLSSIAATDCNNNAVTLTNVNCSTRTVGFFVDYMGDLESSSVANDLTVDCNPCGTNSGFSMGDPAVTGAGNPCPLSRHEWSYTFTVQNCTDSPMTSIKIQGATSGWLDAVNQSVTILPTVEGWSITSKTTGRNNRVWTIKQIQGHTLAIGASVAVRVSVTGRVSNNCDEVMYLSGPWSATGTKTTDNTQVTTTYTSRASLFVDCSEDCQPGGN